MAEIKITGKKVIRTIHKEFQEKYPFLGITIFTPEEWEKCRKNPGPDRHDLYGHKRLSEVRTKTPKVSSEISIHGRTVVKNIEDHFVNEYGLHAQVIYGTKDGLLHYTAEAMDSMTLTQLNKYIEEQGFKKKPKLYEYEEKEMREEKPKPEEKKGFFKKLFGK